MNGAPKISSCVDCATPIIGDRPRCPACHDRHAASLLAGDEDVTIPRDLVTRPMSIWQILLAWLFVAQVVAIAVFLLVLAGRSCQ